MDELPPPPMPKEVSIEADERVLLVLGRSYISFATQVTVGLIVLAIILAIGDFFFHRLLSWIILPLSVFCFSVLRALLYGLGYFYVKGHRYIITEERIIMFRKFIGILMRTVSHDKITDLVVNQGPMGRLCNYGRISPITAGITMPMGVVTFSISGVRNPYEVRNDMAKLLKT